MFPCHELHLHSEEYRCVCHGFPTFAKNERAERAVQTLIAPRSRTRPRCEFAVIPQNFHRSHESLSEGYRASRLKYLSLCFKFFFQVPSDIISGTLDSISITKLFFEWENRNRRPAVGWPARSPPLSFRPPVAPRNVADSSKEFFSLHVRLLL